MLERAQQWVQSVALVNLALYPGRSGFSYFTTNIPALVVEPLGERGWLLVAGWSVRCFSRSDELWITGLAEKLRTELESVDLDQVTGLNQAAQTQGEFSHENQEL